MKELIQISQYPINHLTLIESPLYVVDFIGNDTLTSIIKMELKGRKSENHLRRESGMGELQRERDCIEFWIRNNQLDTNTTNWMLCPDVIFCNDNVLRLFCNDYAPDKLKFYAEQIIKNSTFTEVRISVVVRPNKYSTADLDLFKNTYKFNIINTEYRAPFYSVVNQVNETLIYED